jgi:hypothetical protein
MTAPVSASINTALGAVSCMGVPSSIGASAAACPKGSSRHTQSRQTILRINRAISIPSSLRPYGEILVFPCQHGPNGARLYFRRRSNNRAYIWLFLSIRKVDRAKKATYTTNELTLIPGNQRDLTFKAHEQPEENDHEEYRGPGPFPIPGI